MSDLIKKQEGILKSLSRRNWLRNTAIGATSAIMLFLSGCTKEQWDPVKGGHPGGGLGSEQDTLYELKVTYTDQYGQTFRKQSIGPYWQYIALNMNAGRFRLYPGKNGFYYLQFAESGWRDANDHWLSLKFNGWAYHSDEENRVGWKIVDGKLYSDYSRWKDYPLGCQWGSTVFGFEAYYVGVNLGDNNVFTNCELMRVR